MPKPRTDNEIGRRASHYLNDTDIFSMRREIAALEVIMEDLLTSYAELQESRDSIEESAEEKSVDLAVRLALIDSLLANIRQYASELSKIKERGQKLEDRRSYVISVQSVHKWQMALVAAILQVLAEMPEKRKELLVLINSAQIPETVPETVEGEYVELDSE